MRFKCCDNKANSADPDQIASLLRSSLIWIYIVYISLSIWNYVSRKHAYIILTP